VKSDLLYELLGVDPEAGPAELLFRARGIHYQLPYLVLSVAAREGARMGVSSRDELRRAHVRADRYAELGAQLGSEFGVRQVKGVQLARYYPNDLLRPQGDIDLVAADQATLWNAVRRVVAGNRVENIDITVFGPHVMVTMFWPATDPLSDPWYKVEFCTAALTGDFETVPVRPALPDHDIAACLIALAEEGLQREFRARDVVDLLMLSEVDFPVGEVAGLVDEYRLAPETVAMLKFAAKHIPLGTLAPLATALADAAERERDRRAAGEDGFPSPGGDVAAKLASGFPVHGMYLRRTASREDWPAARVLPFEEGHLLLTPVADYLLTDQAVVTREQYDLAAAALARWDGEQR
jgi:hypothetical protein